MSSSSTVSRKLGLTDEAFAQKGGREWQRGFHSDPLLPLVALQRGHLPQVVEQELQGHQPPPVLHHVRGQDQHRSRLQFLFKLCGNVIDTLKIHKNLDIDLFCFK